MRRLLGYAIGGAFLRVIGARLDLAEPHPRNPRSPVQRRLFLAQLLLISRLDTIEINLGLVQGPQTQSPLIQAGSSAVGRGRAEQTAPVFLSVRI